MDALDRDKKRKIYALQKKESANAEKEAGNDAGGEEAAEKEGGEDANAEEEEAIVEILQKYKKIKLDYIDI